MRKLLLVVCIVLIACSAVYGYSPVLLQDDLISQPLGKKLEYLEDPDGKLTFENILSAEISNQFKPGDRDILNFGITDSVFWSRFTLSNQADHTKTILFSVNQSLTESVDVYIRKSDGSLIHKKGGMSVAFKQKEIYHRDHVFRLNFLPNETVDVTVRTHAMGANLLDLSVWNPESYWQADRTTAWLLGLAIGGFIVLALYHLMLYVKIRDRLYLYYIFFLLSYVVYVLSLEGLAAQYFWPNLTWWAGHCTAFLSGLAMFSGILFVRDYLKSPKAYPRLDKYFIGLAAFTMLAGLIGFVDYMIGNYATTLAGFIVLTSLPLSILYVWRRGFRLAINFFLAWLVFFVSTIFFILTITGAIEANDSTFMSLAIGFLVGGIMLAIVVGQRINDVTFQYQTDLEKQVKRQTASLKETVVALQIEVNERIKAEQGLQYRVDLVQVISHLSTMFINQKFSEIDQGINRALEVIGRFLDVGRSYAFILSEDEQTLNCMYEWTQENIEPRAKQDQRIHVNAWPWWMEKLRQFDSIYLHDIEQIPSEATSEKESMKRQKTKSLLVVPLIFDGNLTGFLGFDSVREERKWGEEEIALLDTVGMIVVNAIARKEVEEELARHREHLEELVEERTGELVTVNRQLEKDIAERKRAEAEKEKLEEQLRQSQKMEAIGRLAGGIAHDFNNILTGIIGYTEMILQSIGQVDPLYPDLMEVKLAAERAATLTAQLLAFSRKQVIRPVITNLADVIARSKNMLARIIGEDIVFYFRGTNQPWSILADPNQIEQVLINLVINARDAMPTGGRLDIGLSNIEFLETTLIKNEEIPPGEYVRLTVSDSGQGMDPEIQEHIFEPFFSTKTRDKGTGLGLATVYGIIKQNQGYIVVESEINKGSLFSIYLPRRYENNKQEEEKPVEEETNHQPAVLLVADEEMILNFGRRVLEAEGFQVLFAADGYEAMQVCKQFDGNIRLMVADSELNRGGGPTLFNQIKQVYPSLKTVFMTDSDEPDAHNQEIYYISKPFTLEGFTLKIRQIMKENGDWKQNQG